MEFLVYIFVGLLFIKEILWKLRECKHGSVLPLPCSGLSWKVFKLLRKLDNQVNSSKHHFHMVWINFNYHLNVRNPITHCGLYLFLQTKLLKWGNQICHFCINYICNILIFGDKWSLFGLRFNNVLRITLLGYFNGHNGII